MEPGRVEGLPLYKAEAHWDPISVSQLCAQARLLDTFTSAPNYTYTASNADFSLVTLEQPLGCTTGWMGLEYSTAATEVVDLTTTGIPRTALGYTNVIKRGNEFELQYLAEASAS